MSTKMKEVLKDRFNWAASLGEQGAVVAAEVAIAYADAILMDANNSMFGEEEPGYNAENDMVALEKMDAQLETFFNQFSSKDRLDYVEKTVKIAAARNYIAKAASGMSFMG